MTVEKMEFKTEVKELLDLMIHSLYSTRKYSCGSLFRMHLMPSTRLGLNRSRTRTFWRIQGHGK